MTVKTNSAKDRIREDEAVYLARKKRGVVRGTRRYRLVDLFSGAGGLTLGFTRSFGHDFKCIWANDINDHAMMSYNVNFGKHCVNGEIDNILKEKPSMPQADVVIGGPPCQGFSLLNKKRNGDPRRQLWRPFLEVVRRTSAKVFLMENVPQLLGSDEHEQIVQAARKMGFEVAWAKLCSADYGVSQTRRRAFLLGCAFRDPWEVFPPKRTNYGPNDVPESALLRTGADHIKGPEPWRTVRDAIGDLPEPVGTQIRNEAPPLDLHFGRNPTPLSIKRYRTIPKEGMNRFDLQERAPELTPPCWIRK
ncbi:MAG: DNA (cytosine-5-)-methyltransferase, partial [Planctomycetes bacterium]|nr:DNA (cytosine-5-)-methyltransferase [Planctomycetota bacterium]